MDAAGGLGLRGSLPDPAGPGQRRWEKFLHTHKLARPETYQNRLELFAQALALSASEPLTQAKRCSLVYNWNFA